jgi:hypothetical protein
MTQQSTENMEYVRNLLRQIQPAFSAALELAAEDAAHAIASHTSGCFARDFATADGERVAIAPCPVRPGDCSRRAGRTRR